jgi:hypothetical protein
MQRPPADPKLPAFFDHLEFTRASTVTPLAVPPSGPCVDVSCRRYVGHDKNPTVSYSTCSGCSKKTKKKKK